MDWLVDVEWLEILRPDIAFLEIAARGTLVYLFVFTMFRVVFKREAGSLGITDLIVVVFVADASQNAMAGGYSSVPDGLLLVAVIGFWAYALDWAAYRFPRLERFIKPPPLTLVEDGQMLVRNMKKELLTPDELMSHLRQSGVSDLDEVQRAHLESNGRISIVRRSRDDGV